MHTDHQQQLRLLGWDQRDYEAIAGSVVLMGAGGSSGFHQRARVLQCAIDFCSGALPGGLFHSSHHFARAGLVAASIEFQVGMRHVQRRNEPTIPYPDQIRA